MRTSDIKYILNQFILLGLPTLSMALVSFFRCNLWMSYFAIAVWFVIVLLLYNIDIKFFSLSFFLLFAQTTALISCAYIESGNYILEQLSYGFSTGATSRLLFYNSIFFIVALWCYKFLLYINRNTSNLGSVNTYQVPAYLMKICLTVSWLIILTLLISILKYGSPLILKIDRFAYWTNHPLPYLQTFKTKLSLISFLCGFLSITATSNELRLLRFTFLAVIFTNILYGEKFSGIYVAMIMYFLPLMIIKGRAYFRLFFRARIILSCCVIILSIFVLIGYQYSVLYESKSAVQLIIDRAFGLQGHLWWGIDELNLNRTKKLYSFYSILIGSTSSDEDAGIHALMYAVSPIAVVKAYLANNVRYSMANPAIALYSLGSLGLFFYQIITGVFFGVFSYYFIIQIEHLRLVRSIICVIIFTALFEALLMGNWYIVFTFFLIKYFLLILAIEIFSLFKTTILSRKLELKH